MVLIIQNYHPTENTDMYPIPGCTALDIDSF